MVQNTIGSTHFLIEVSVVRLHVSHQNLAQHKATGATVCNELASEKMQTDEESLVDAE